VLLVILSRHWIAFAAWTAPCSAAPSGSSPKAACGAPKARGLTRMRVRAIIICRRNVQKSFGAVRGTVDCYCGDLSFHRHE